MSGFNRVVLCGNLTRDPETKFAPSGLAVVNFGLAVNEQRKQGEEWVDAVTFVDCTFFGKRGEAFARFHTKGKLALIEGRLRLDQWDDKATGAKRSKLYVVVDQFTFVGGKDERQAQPAQTQAAEAKPWDGETATTAVLPVDETPF